MFEQRSADIEIMDDLGCHGAVVDQTLRELELINKWLGGNAVTLEGVQKLAKGNEQEPITIADLGCGSGDILRLLSAWGQKSNVKLKLTGIDANPHIIEFARRRCADFPDINFEVLDIFSPEFSARSFDIVTGTLFFHHFDTARLTELFSQLTQQSNLGIVINDIHRHVLAYYSIKGLTSLFSRSSMVKFDAPLSVLRSFRKNELEKILADAGMSSYEMRWKWAFRWQVIWRKAKA
jgi:SAM-dependent methyltransferase